MCFAATNAALQKRVHGRVAMKFNFSEACTTVHC